MTSTEDGGSETKEEKPQVFCSPLTNFLSTFVPIQKHVHGWKAFVNSSDERQIAMTPMNNFSICPGFLFHIIHSFRAAIS